MSKVYDGDEPYLFVSYSHKDKDYVEKIIQSLQRQTCNIWYDIGITAGESWNENIAKHLKNSKCVLAFISENSISSEYVLDEIYYAKKNKIKLIPCYVKNILLPDELDLSIGRIQAVDCYSQVTNQVVDKIKSLVPKEVFHETTSPFYTGLINSFFLERTSVPFEKDSCFAGENLESFEIYWRNQERNEDSERNLLWRYKFMPALELDALSISYSYKFEDPYFDDAKTDVVLFNVIINASGRYPTPYPCVHIILTIGIIDIDTQNPKLIVINKRIFNQDDFEDSPKRDFDTNFAKSLLEDIVNSIELK